MNKNFPCDIIRDLLPGYIDEILSETGTNSVQEHLAECEACHKAYLEMKEDWTSETEVKEQIAIDGFKKVRRRTRTLKIALGAALSLLLFFTLSIFLKVFVIGKPLSTHEIEINTEELSYDEETACLTINGTVNLASCRVTGVEWQQSEEDKNEVNILVYAAETLPFQPERTEFNLTVPDMKGKTAYLACPEYDRRELYNWKHYHNEKMMKLENEIYDRFPELDRNRDALSYTGGIETADGMEGIRFCVHSVIGENATFWTFNDQIITDGDLESRDFEIWISLEEPYQILLFDYRTGQYTDDTSIFNRH